MVGQPMIGIEAILRRTGCQIRIHSDYRITDIHGEGGKGILACSVSSPCSRHGSTPSGVESSTLRAPPPGLHRGLFTFKPSGLGSRPLF